MHAKRLQSVRGARWPKPAVLGTAVRFTSGVEEGWRARLVLDCGHIKSAVFVTVVVPSTSAVCHPVVEPAQGVWLDACGYAYLLCRLFVRPDIHIQTTRSGKSKVGISIAWAELERQQMLTSSGV